MAKVRKFGSGGEVPDFSRLTFKEAFQAARGGPNTKEAMNDTFMWNGKKYSTKMDSGKKGPAYVPGKIGSMDSGIPKSGESKSESKSEKESPKQYSSSKTERLLEEATAEAKRASSDKSLLAAMPAGSALSAIRNAGSKAIQKFADRNSSTPSPKRTEGSMKNTARMDAEDAAAQGARRDPKSREESSFADEGNPNFKRGGKVKKMASGGSASSASKRADGCAVKGKTRGKMY